jgi:outer membrane protein OmpA-like peptidoglycan-associated protein
MTEDVLDQEVSDASAEDEGSMAELRTLLLGPVETQLNEVHSRLLDPQRQVQEVSHVLPAAIAVRSRQDDELTDALAPTVASALNRSIRKNPQPLADALFPVMGPAIRKAISTALSGMIQSFNQTLSHSMSIRGLRWRLEALRTGKSFAEVVMLHTLLYSVEQVFLIHKETGLLLKHVTAGTVPVQDADMVSGMLTAIQDFVHDSFDSRKADQLDSLRVGELTVWIERGPLAVLAGVIRGNAPKEVRSIFSETLERIHLQYGGALKSFQGDASPFAQTEPLLEECLHARYRELQIDAGSGRKVTPFTVIVAVLLVALLIWGFFWIRGRQRWEAYLQQLRTEPGILLTDGARRDGKYYVSGLRDPLARDPQAILQGSKINPQDVVSHWEPFTALSPEFVLARAKKLLAPPATINLKLQDNALEAEGFATHSWVVKAREGARWLPGLGQFHEDKLLDLEQIENPLLLFKLDSADFVPGQEAKFESLAADIGRLQSLAETMQKNVRLEISGHADSSGSEARNTTLTLERAQAVVKALQTKLPKFTNLTIQAVGTKEKLREELTEADRGTNRSVTFKVVATDSQ